MDFEMDCYAVEVSVTKAARPRIAEHMAGLAIAHTGATERAFIHEREGDSESGHVM